MRGVMKVCFKNLYNKHVGMVMVLADCYRESVRKKFHPHTFFMTCAVLYITAANLPSEVCSFLMTPEIRGTGWSWADMWQMRWKCESEGHWTRRVFPMYHNYRNTCAGDFVLIQGKYMELNGLHDLSSQTHSYWT